MDKTHHRRFRIPPEIAVALVLLLAALHLDAGEPPPEPGWQRVTCEGCDYSLEVPAFGHHMKISLRPIGGRIQNYDPMKLKTVSDGFPELLAHQYYLEIRVSEPSSSLEEAKEEVCRFHPPSPLDRPEPSFRCEFEGLGGDSTQTDYAEVRVDGRVYWMAIDAHKLSRDTVDRIFNSLVIHAPQARASE